MDKRALSKANFKEFISDFITKFENEEDIVSIQDFIVNQLVNKLVDICFNDVFSDEELKGFVYEGHEEIVFILENCLNVLIDVAKERVDESCYKFVYSPFSANFSGRATLKDGTESYVCMLTCDIADKSGNIVAQVIACILYENEDMEKSYGVKYAVLKEGKVVFGDLDEYVEQKE